VDLGGDEEEGMRVGGGERRERDGGWLLEKVEENFGAEFGWEVKEGEGLLGWLGHEYCGIEY
jgi:hypothetical protein